MLRKRNAIQKMNLLTFYHLQRLDRNIPALLEEMERPAVAERDDIVVSSDAVALEAMFEDLTKRKEDDQVLYLGINHRGHSVLYLGFQFM